MGIKLIYLSGLLEEFKVIIQVHNHLYEFLGLKCVSEYIIFFFILEMKYGGNTTYFVLLQHDQGLGLVIRHINISAETNEYL